MADEKPSLPYCIELLSKATLISSMFLLKSKMEELVVVQKERKLTPAVTPSRRCSVAE